MSRLVSSSSLNKTFLLLKKRVTPHHHLVAWWCSGPQRRELRSQFHAHYSQKKHIKNISFSKHNTSERWPGHFKGFLVSFPGRFALIQNWGYCKRIQVWLNMHIMVVSFNLIAATRLLSLPDLSIFLNFTSTGKFCAGCVVSRDLGRLAAQSWDSLAHCSELADVHQTGHVPPDVPLTACTPTETPAFTSELLILRASSPEKQILHRSRESTTVSFREVELLKF